MTWMALALLATSTGCTQPMVNIEEARAIFREAVAERSSDPSRYLSRPVTASLRCKENRGIWLVRSWGPSGSFDDVEMVVIEGDSAEFEHTTAACTRPLALTAGQATVIARRLANHRGVQWTSYQEPFLRSHCPSDQSPYWLYSAMHRSLAPDSMLLIRIDDASGNPTVVPQG